MDAVTLDVGIALGAVGGIIATIIVAGVGLATLIIRSTARTDRLIERTDRRIDRLDHAMAIFRAEMQILAERQARIEGRLDERGAAAD